MWDLRSGNCMRSALARTLEMAQALGGSQHGVDLLRKESLSGLAPAAARRVLVHSYVAIIPITPLPFPPLPSTAAPNGGIASMIQKITYSPFIHETKCKSCALCLSSRARRPVQT